MESSLYLACRAGSQTESHCSALLKPGEKSAQSTEETVGTVTKGVLLITFLAW